MSSAFSATVGVSSSAPLGALAAKWTAALRAPLAGRAGATQACCLVLAGARGVVTTLLGYTGGDGVRLQQALDDFYTQGWVVSPRGGS